MTDLLGRGDLLPRIVVPPPGPRSRELATAIRDSEAPVVNTLYAGEPSVVWAEAAGSNVLDVDGNRYLDFTAGFGVASIGHRHPGVVEAVRAQAERLVHGLADVATHPGRIELAARLRDLAPVEEGRVYFAASGSDAVEVALKSAWLATDRRSVVAFEPAYHGTTLGALALTSREAFRRPFLAQLTANVSRLPHGASLETVASRLADEDVAAVLVEPIVGREGVRLPPPGWLAGLARACREHGSLLVADEIYTGFGRTGSWFVSAAEGARPDLICCGKALGGGLPIAAVVGRREVMAAWDHPGEALHTSTFLANPLSCAAALAALDILEAEGLVERSARLGERVEETLAAWRDLPTVRSVVGRGLLWGVELVDEQLAQSTARRARERGLMILASGRRLQIAPPLVITAEQIGHGLELLADLLAPPS